MSIDQPTEAASPESVIAAKNARAIDEHALRTIFKEARTANGFLPVPIPRETLEAVFDLAILGPTSANTQPLRIVFVESPEAKEKLLATLSPGNVDKTREAPVTVIFAADTKFYEHIPRTFPQSPQFKNLFEGDDKAAFAAQFADMNATLQGAYFMLAARAVGLDVGPMAGFDKAKVDEAFFPDGRYKSLWLANVGYGDDGKVFPRNPRLGFEEVAKFA